MYRSKLNRDWLFRAEPLRTWMADKTDFPLIGSFFQEEWAVLSFNYSSVLLDLLIVPFLLWRKTRWYAIGIAISFHLLNSQLFNIGIFPWFMIAATLLFLSPDWPRRALSYFLKKRNVDTTKAHKQGIYASHKWSSRQRTIIILLMIYFIVQLGVPLRHYLYPGNNQWTGEGAHFSWHMRLNIKASAPMEFHVIVPASGETFQVYPKDITTWQSSKMHNRPDMILMYSHHMADVFSEQGYGEVEVRVKTLMSLNGREPQQLIDPTVDLAAQPRTLLPATWILPLE